MVEHLLSLCEALASIPCNEEMGVGNDLLVLVKDASDTLDRWRRKSGIKSRE